MSQPDTSADLPQQPPRVTVFIPVFNRERHVGAAIESILAQRYTDFELLLIDDGSTDASLAVMRSYRDPRVRVIHRPDNRGIPATRNEGLRLARGEYIALLDSDDWATPDRLAKQVSFLDRHPAVAAVGSWSLWMDADGRPLGKIKRRPLAPGDIAAWRLFCCPITNSSVMARTALLRIYGYREQHTVTEDFDLWSWLARDHSLVNLPRPLVWRRRHPGQIGPASRPLRKAQDLTIISEQLDQLAVAYEVSDLERHYLLTRLRKTGFAPDPEYLKWAEQWLTRLRDANRRARIYPGSSFERMLGELWCALVWLSLMQLGVRPVWRLARSPLCAGAFIGLPASLWERIYGVVERMSASAPGAG